MQNKILNYKHSKLFLILLFIMTTLFVGFFIYLNNRTTLSTNILPKDAKVYINDVLINKNYKPSTGEYRLKIKREGFNEINQDIQIKKGDNVINEILIPNSELGKEVEKKYSNKDLQKVQSKLVKEQAKKERESGITTHTGDDSKMKIHYPQLNIVDERDLLYNLFSSKEGLNGFIQNLQVFLYKNNYKHNESLYVESITKDNLQEPYPIYVNIKIIKDNQKYVLKIDYDSLNKILYFINDQSGYKNSLVLGL